VLVNDLLFVNFYWGLVNLLPVWPLDGGHISRALLEQWDRYDGRRKSLIASAVIAAAVALAGIANENTWLTIMFGLFAVSSLQAMEGERQRIVPSYRRWRD
jgi:Zn-dependent protease